MTESSWPFDNADTSESQYSTLMRFFGDTGVLGSPSTTDLKPYGDGSGMNVKIPGLPSFALVQGFVYSNDSLVTKTIAASGTQPRTDWVILQLDTANNTVLIVVKQGVPGGTPAALVQSGSIYELKLADVTVPANATTISAANVTDRRTFASLPFGRWTTDGRPTAPLEGKTGWNFTLKAIEFWDGTAWRNLSTSGGTSASSLTSGTLPTARLDYGVMAAYRGDRGVEAPVYTDGSGTAVINGDWNSILQPGVYRIQDGYTNTNMPNGAYRYGTLVVFGAGVGIESVTQEYFAHDGGHFWRTAWNRRDWRGWVSAQNNISSQSAQVAPQSGWAKRGGNQVTAAVKTGRQVTLVYQLTAPGYSDNNNNNQVLWLPDPSFWPVGATDHVARSTEYVPLIGMAMDGDGLLRIRSGSVNGGGSIYGSVTWITQ